jgi:hypothetical protein
MARFQMMYKLIVKGFIITQLIENNNYHINYDYYEWQDMYIYLHALMKVVLNTG